MRTGEGFLLVYSITSRPSFDEIMGFHQQILRVSLRAFPVPPPAPPPLFFLLPTSLTVCSPPWLYVSQVKDKDFFPVVVVANKLDLEYDRQVGRSEGENLAKSFGAVLLEASAKDRVNVDESFYELVRAIRRYNKVSDARRAFPVVQINFLFSFFFFFHRKSNGCAGFLY